jgi:hypothetical protein
MQDIAHGLSVWKRDVGEELTLDGGQAEVDKLELRLAQQEHGPPSLTAPLLPSTLLALARERDGSFASVGSGTLSRT